MEKGTIREVYLGDNHYTVFYRLFVLTLIAIPVAAYLLGNWWLSLGVLFYLLSSWIAVITIPSLLVYSIWIWFAHGFSFSQYGTFFLACSVAGFLLFTIARKKIYVEPEEHDCSSFATKEDFQAQLKSSLQEHLN
jgi:hypothetical protein